VGSALLGQQVEHALDERGGYAARQQVAQQSRQGAADFDESPQGAALLAQP
jgi:hypothetical protein